MTESEYRAVPALSFSSMKDLAVSPYRFWYLHVNPNRPKIEPTKEQAFGQALHCAVLQPPDVWDNQYACEMDKSRIEDLLITVDDMKQWLLDKGYALPTGKALKADYIKRVHACDPNWPIWEVLETQHYARNQGKTMISCADFDRIAGCTEALKSEPRLAKVLEEGRPEVECFWQDPETGVDCKCRFDWLSNVILDLKTFQQKARKSIDESVADAIWWEGYLKQGWFYTEGEMLERLKTVPSTVIRKPFLFAFVESELPHEVRLRRFQFGDSLYYKQTELEVRRLIELYAECRLTYGEEPWRDAQEIVELQDEQFRQLGWT
jgi:PDDEXK-like uncharacterized protein DUF3799